MGDSVFRNSTLALASDCVWYWAGCACGEDVCQPGMGRLGGAVDHTNRLSRCRSTLRNYIAGWEQDPRPRSEFRKRPSDIRCRSATLLWDSPLNALDGRGSTLNALSKDNPAKWCRQRFRNQPETGMGSRRAVLLIISCKSGPWVRKARMVFWYCLCLRRQIS